MALAVMRGQAALAVAAMGAICQVVAVLRPILVAAAAALETLALEVLAAQAS